MKYSHLYIFYTSLKQACIKNIRLHFGLPFKILLNYNILAVLSSFGTSIANIQYLLTNSTIGK